MGRHDWYRCTARSDAEREFFEQKLRRATRAGRPGYLRVQGTVLSGSNDPELRAAGRELLERAIEAGVEWSPLEAQWARMNLARAFVREERLAEAESYYRECAKHQDLGGYGLKTDCHLGLAEALLRRSPGDAHAAEEAAAALDRAVDVAPPVFHAEGWRFCAALARVAAARGEHDRARGWAEQALGIVEHQEPQLSRHPGIGLARPGAEDIREMEHLAGHIR